MIKINQVTSYIKDPLRKNSVFMIATSVSTAILGFLFWMLAARLYHTDEIGLSSAIVSAAQMLAVFSGLGFGIGVIRFLHQEQDKRLMVNTVFTITSIFSFILVAVFVAGLNLWSPNLLIIRQDALMLAIFILFTVSANLQSLQNSVFIAFRSTQYNLVQSLINGLRIPFLFVLVGFGKVGILSPFASAMFIAYFITNLFLRKVYPGYKLFPSISTKIARKIIRFSLGNYIGDGFRLLPYLLLPIIIINVLNPEMSAYFFIAWTVANLFFGVAYYTSFSFLAEVSNNLQTIRHQLIKVTRFVFPILGIAIILVFFLGHELLSLFGGEYSTEAEGLLRILTISSLSVAFNELYISVKRVEKKIKPIICAYGFVALVTIIGGSLLLKSTGLNGTGYAWLASNLLVSVIVLPSIINRFSSKNVSLEKANLVK